MLDKKLSFSSLTLSSLSNIVEPVRVTLIDGGEAMMQSLEDALKACGYATYLCGEVDEAAEILSKTDILLMDSIVAQRPKSSKLIKAPTILVLSPNENDRLPPWLEARHVFSAAYPNHPSTLINRLPEYTTPPAPDFDSIPTDPQHLTLLLGITQTLSGHFLDINDLFERILLLAPYLGADFAGLLVQEGDETIYYRSTQPGREELIGPAGRRFAQRLVKHGLEGWVLRHNQATVLANTMMDSRWFRASYLPDDEHCAVALPIKLERVEAKGVYLIGHNEPERFRQEDLPLLKAVTAQISMAIENAMLFKNQSERSLQLALINEVGQAATSILNLDAMLRTVVQAIRRSFTFHSVSIHLYNPDKQIIELRAIITSNAQHQQVASKSLVRHKLRQGLIGWAAATNKTILANDVARDPRYIFDSGNREVRAELCIPIALGTKIIGVLDLQSMQLEAFDRYQVSALETLADQLAIAIENARLYDAIHQRVSELKSLNEIGQAINSTLDLQKILEVITSHTTRLMDVAAASVALRDDETNEICFAAASGEGAEVMPGLRMPLGQGVAGWVAEQGEAVIVQDVYADQRFFADVDKQSGFTTKSILCVPLQTKGHTIGAIEVMNKRVGVFNKEDQSLLQALAASAATAIENARLYEEQGRTINRLAETQSQLIQSAKLAAVGELAAGVAHEINNPLTTIIALTSLLADRSISSTEEERSEDLQIINVESRRARDIVRNLLDFARADSPKRQPVDLNQLIEEAILLVYTKNLNQKVALQKILRPLPEMSLDINQIKQVFVNLFSNALQSMQDNSTRPANLTISTQFIASSASHKNDGGAELANGSHVICKISDTGSGIQPEHIHKIFDPFFTTKEVGQGTGLGLSISYGIIKKHDGNIILSSTPEQGTTFTIMLPFLDGPTNGV